MEEEKISEELMEEIPVYDEIDDQNFEVNVSSNTSPGKKKV